LTTYIDDYLLLHAFKQIISSLQGPLRNIIDQNVLISLNVVVLNLDTCRLIISHSIRTNTSKGSIRNLLAIKVTDLTAVARPKSIANIDL